MRLIDADALINVSERESNVDGAYGYIDTKSIIDKIDDAPTIEPERKKGEWIDLDYTEAWLYKCDQCGRRSDFKDNYCPDCGADMRGDSDD